ncbi:MAG: 50S ribosomal protein L11 [Candidatus Marsarchaeota archaeon]|nr:50S ribosomal protein L11 [Candidatus Marsarchaeota archaeon]
MKTINVMVEGGKASLAPPLGPALGPLGLDSNAVVKAINDKTKAFSGMQVPVNILIEGKSFEIEVGTPPTASLIKNELGLKEPVKEEAGVKGKKTIGNLTIQQVKKIAEMKMDSMLSKTLESSERQVIGTCVSLGVTIEGKSAKDFMKDLKEGKASLG